jgi:hypothetical protein
MHRVLSVLLVALTLPIGSAASAQDPPTGAGTPSLAVYLDCRVHCDTDFIRTEIDWIDWVRDRTVADVHLLITSQQSGAGGEAYTMAFLGLRALASHGDTLIFSTNPTTTSDETRRGMTRMIELGLVSFAARTPAGSSLTVSSSAQGDRAATNTNPRNDPWKAWVFEVELRGSTDGEQRYRNREVSTELSANRVTLGWKTNIEYRFTYEDDRVTVQEFDDLGNVTSEETFRNLQRDWNVDLLQVKSVSPHVSIGAELEVASQTFRNQRLRYELRPAVEYNVFPYSESTRRELSFRYGIGVTGYRYADTTVFDKLRETLPSQFFNANYRNRQQWGEASLSAQHRNFLNDASKRSTEVNGEISVRVFRGFSVNFGGGYNWIRDQIYLPKEEGDQVDVLLRRRALLTGYEYHLDFGISYTFGSIFNNVVNPRF